MEMALKWKISLKSHQTILRVRNFGSNMLEQLVTWASCRTLQEPQVQCFWVHVQWVSLSVSTAGYSIKTWMNPLISRSDFQKVKLKGKFGRRFQVGAQKLALAVSVSLASLGRGVFGICLPRDSYFEFGSLGTHWPSSLPHRHLPPLSIRLICWTASR